jgi:hypothetical protein
MNPKELFNQASKKQPGTYIHGKVVVILYHCISWDIDLNNNDPLIVKVHFQDGRQKLITWANHKQNDDGKELLSYEIKDLIIPETSQYVVIIKARYLKSKEDMSKPIKQNLISV